MTIALKLELRLDHKEQESILLGVVRAMNHGQYGPVNAMRREGDDVVVYYDPQRDPAREPSAIRRMLAWCLPNVFAIEATPV